MSKGIRIKNICKSFGEKTVLDNFSMDLKSGEITCIKGPSGYGKTTLLRIIAGLETADSGTVEKEEGSIAFVFQEDRLAEDFNAVTNIRLVTGKKLSNDEICAHLEEIGLTDDLNKPVRKFSGGMKRRVAIARAVCSDADYLLMDEPFKGLDEKLKSEVMDYVKRHSAGKTVVFVTHDPAEAEYMGGRQIILGE